MALFGALRTLPWAASCVSCQPSFGARTILTQFVLKDQVNNALGKIQDTVRYEGLENEWRAKQRRVRPCVQRKLDTKASKKKITQARFKEQIQAILSRKSRGF